MPDKKLMKLMVEVPGVIRGIYLTDPQIEVFDIVKATDRLGVTSAWLSEYMDISVQSASGRLAALEKKKYLTRINEGAESGGDEYVYHSAI